MRKTETYAGRVLEFSESEEELRALYGPPSELAARKCLPRLDEHCRHFIELSPFLCLSSAAADGSADISPRGDAPGFVRVLDELTLFVPDRLGNNRIDTLRNLMHNPHVGLLFLIPGVDETLRVNGVARVVLRSELLDESTVGGKTPRSGILVEVREAFLQCAKALKRSRLWSDDYRLTREQMPTLGKMLADQLCLTTPVSELDAMGTQTAIAAKIVDGGGDYVLPLKGNQSQMEQAVREFFTDHLEDNFARVKVSRLETTETHHGRVEQRSYFQVNVPDDLPGRPRWKGLRTLGLVIRTREINGVETDEIQCSISSLKRNVKLFAKAVRGHWGIENTCHWTLDMTFREDESRTRDRHVCENLAWLRRFALGLLKQHPNTKTSLAMKRRQAGWCVSFLSEVLFNSTT